MNRAAMLANPRYRTGDYAVTRRGAPGLIDGVAQEPAESTFTTGDASLQAASGDTLKLAPEGSSTDNLRDLWTTTLLRTVPIPDVVTVGVEPWVVFNVKDFTGLGGVHYIVSLSRGVTP